VEEGADVEGDQPVERRLVDLKQGLRPIDAGIVDEDVEALELGESGAHRGRVGDIEGKGMRGAAQHRDLGCDPRRAPRGCGC
jgi:hypothetical protein